MDVRATVAEIRKNLAAFGIESDDVRVWGNMEGIIEDALEAEDMSLRDHFAASAVTGGLCFHQEDGCARDADEVAERAYNIADAMLKVRAA